MQRVVKYFILRRFEYTGLTGNPVENGKKPAFFFYLFHLNSLNRLNEANEIEKKNSLLRLRIKNCF